VRCDLCAEPLAEEHEHLIEPAPRTLSCACAACAVLFDSIGGHRYRRVRPAARRLDPLALSDATWTALGIPVGLAFFSRSSATNAVVAAYPGPAGAVETLVESDHPALADLTPDVEALLVNRLESPPRLYRVSIDWCYRLTGAVRSRWRGISGGQGVQAAIREFFAALERAA
jgi:hypothetical protein